jgi:cobalamin biosynthesis protein CobD/CbiB
MTITLIVFSALLLDTWLGEPRCYHPFIGFGNLAQAVEQWLYADSMIRGLSGVLLLLLLLPAILFITLIINVLPWPSVFEALLLYLAIGCGIRLRLFDHQSERARTAAHIQHIFAGLDVGLRDQCSL